MGRAGGLMDYEGGEDTGETLLTGRGCGSCDLGGEGVGDSCEMGDADVASGAEDQDAEEEGVGVSNTNQSCWTRRVRVGKAADVREPSPSRMPALEASVHAYVDKKSENVVNPSIGTSFDSVEEGYEFYNLYSWEVGFGVRYAKSRLDVHRKKCMQEIVCACASGHMVSGRCWRLSLDRTDEEEDAMATLLCFSLGRAEGEEGLECAEMDTAAAVLVRYK